MKINTVTFENVDGAYEVTRTEGNTVEFLSTEGNFRYSFAEGYTVYRSPILSKAIGFALVALAKEDAGQ